MLKKVDFSKYNLNVSNIKKISENEYFLKVNNVNYYLTKSKTNYEFLFAASVNSICYPVRINSKYYLKLNNVCYNLFLVENSLKYPEKNKVLDLMHCLKEIHTKTEVKKRISPETAIPRMKKMYETLSGKFNRIENFIQIIESKNEYSDLDYLILNRNYILLDIKNYLAKLQSKILDKIEKGLEITVSLNHFNPTLYDLIDKRIHINSNVMTIPVVDIALFYINLNYIDFNIKEEIIEWLAPYDDFYYLYFKYLVLYIYIHRLPLNTIHGYIEVVNVIEDFLQLFLITNNNNKGKKN